MLETVLKVMKKGGYLANESKGKAYNSTRRRPSGYIKYPLKRTLTYTTGVEGGFHILFAIVWTTRRTIGRGMSLGQVPFTWGL